MPVAGLIMRYKPARQLAEDTLTRYRQVLGEDPRTLRSATYLAAVLANRGEDDPDH